MGFARNRMREQGLTRCPECPSTHPVVGADGPPNAQILFVGERPGPEENAKGRVFVGMTGRELNGLYLPLAGLDRRDIRIMNVVCCYGDGAPSPELAESCARHHLYREIARNKPKVVVLMGATATSLVPEIDLEIQHGIPLRTIWRGMQMVIFPTWHPAGGLHSTRTMIPLRRDFEALGRLLAGRLVIPTDAIPNPKYKELTTEDDVRGCVNGAGRYAPTAIDTETLTLQNRKFWCLTFSLEPGTGYMVRSRAALEAFRRWLRTHRGVLILHNWMFDAPVLASVEIDIVGHRAVDTMAMAYHLGDLPQGLKALAYRLCGMKMKSFEDTVMPYAREEWVDYMMKLSTVEWPKPEEQLLPTDDGSFRLYKPHSLSTKLKRLLTDYVKNDQLNIQERWEKWSVEERAPAIERFGQLPPPSIAQVPIAEAVQYSCCDADLTLRIWHELRGRSRRFRHDLVLQ